MGDKEKVMIIGPGVKFLGGVSYYTIALANAFSKKYETSALTFHNLMPKWLFPGNKHVGKINAPAYNRDIKNYAGLQWYLGPSFFKSLRFIKKQNPDVLIFQWWSSTAFHMYWLLTTINRLFWKRKTIIEFHEIVDPYENSFFLLRWYVRITAKLTLKNVDAYTVHSEADKKLMHDHFKIPLHKIFIVPHGSYDHYQKIKVKKDPSICTLLSYGLIRPYKGVEYLIKAFDAIPASEIQKFKLIVVGETWEGHTLPAELISKSKYRNKITFVNKYVTDEEASRFYSQSDVVVLPYLRASQSGAAHGAIYFGLPVICSKVGGLTESMSVYKGTTFVKPGDVQGLTHAIISSYNKRHKRYPNPHPWEKTIKAYEAVI